MGTKQTSTPRAPVLWKFKPISAAQGLFIEDTRCWISDQSGHVFALDHKGNIERHYKLPKSVFALVGDDAWIYAGCANGNIYDLTGPIPRLAYTIGKDAVIDWLDICDGVLAVSLMTGGLTVIDAESRVLWHKDGHQGAFTIRCDHEAVFHGDPSTLTAYHRATGKVLWVQEIEEISFGSQTEDTIYVATQEQMIVAVAKKTGRILKKYVSDSPILSCAASPDGQYVFGGDGLNYFSCWAAKGKQLWSLETGCGSAQSMQYHKGRVYIVTVEGSLACIDVSETAITPALAGDVPEPRALKAPRLPGVTVSSKLETTSDPTKGVILECVAEGISLHIRVASKGYHNDWLVQFPRDARELGAKYVVDEVWEAEQGGFYRAYGNIKKLIPASTGPKAR